MYEWEMEPQRAQTQRAGRKCFVWIPAFAGMTEGGGNDEIQM